MATAQGPSGSQHAGRSGIAIPVTCTSAICVEKSPRCSPEERALATQKPRVVLGKAKLPATAKYPRVCLAVHIMAIAVLYQLDISVYATRTHSIIISVFASFIWQCLLNLDRPLFASALVVALSCHGNFLAKVTLYNIPPLCPLGTSFLLCPFLSQP